MDTPCSPLILLPNVYRAFYGSFTSLTAAQLATIAPLLEGRDLILQASTGSGKTEAVLAPTVESLIASKEERKIIYLVPTRALAMDLERRLTPIFARLGLRFGIRTGDTKRMGGENPDLLLTTPESFDVMLGSSNQEIRVFTKKIDTIIIDEIHAFLQNYRGRQLALLLQRLDCRTKHPLQKVAISATIENPERLIHFFNMRPDTFHYSASTQRTIIPHLVHLKDDERELPALLEDCSQEWGYQKILIFANNRGTCDRLHQILNRAGRFQGATELHYSNLKLKERRGVERRFRKRTFSICIATSTLELGIDIGDVDGVILYEPPESVTNFLQRIGRANRRQQSVHFWGICRGKNQEGQLLRFLGLLRLAEQGKVEDPSPKQLPSVLIQQILSCLYEKKETSLSALKQLFPEEEDRLIPIFNKMKNQGWFRKQESRGLFRPSWRYRDYLLERKLWSNFPETEEEYILEMDRESIADLPESVVTQLDVGDCVQLAGKRIRVQEIVNEEERKRVVATTTPHLDPKEIIWLGGGFRISYEVAQSIRQLLESDTMPDEQANWGLFSRTRKLLRQEYKLYRQTLTLANGMRLGKTHTGFYRYYTFIGAMGNLILQWSLEHSQSAKQENFVVTGDEIAIECSHLIDFQTLSLPKNRGEYLEWIRPHRKAFAGLLQLNTFSKFLPDSLLLEEITDFLFDERLPRAFTNYERTAFKVIRGDIKDLEAFTPDRPNESATLQTQPLGTSLLEWERNRWKQNHSWQPQNFCNPVEYVSKPLTGTLIGDYFRKQQCARSFHFHFLNPEQAPPKPNRIDDDTSLARMEWGQNFETEVLESLRSQYDQLIVIVESDVTGARLSLTQRFQQTVEQVEKSIASLSEDPNQTILLAQAVLLYPSLLTVSSPVSNKSLPSLRFGSNKPLTLKKTSTPDFPDSSPTHDKPSRLNKTDPQDLSDSSLGNDRLLVSNDDTRDLSSWNTGKALILDGVGIPDLIQISMTNGKPELQVGDIKSSHRSQYSQKWQVAFYSFLLQKIMPSHLSKQALTIASEGVLITQSFQPEELSKRETFDLKPFWASIPALLRNMERTLTMAPQNASYQLDGYCSSCHWFEYCYQEALRTEELRFIPELTAGMLEKLRNKNLSTLQQVQDYLTNQGRKKIEEDTITPKQPEEIESNQLFTPDHRERLVSKIDALRSGRIVLRSKATRLFSASVSHSIFIHLHSDAISGELDGLGWLVIAPDKAIQERKIFLQSKERTSGAWIDHCADSLLALWNRYVEQGETPHLFYFGSSVRTALQDWFGNTPIHFLWMSQQNHSTDLRRLVSQHFDLPIPGKVTLFALNRLLGTSEQLPAPNSFFHPDVKPDLSLQTLQNEVQQQQNLNSNVHLPKAINHEEALSSDANNHSEKIEKYLQQFLITQMEVGKWAFSHINGERVQRNPSGKVEPEEQQAEAWANFLEEEHRLRRESILTLQGFSLEERVQRYRSIGPLRFQESVLDEEGHFLYRFSVEWKQGDSKFREGDFLKLTPLGTPDLQKGNDVILERFDRSQNQLWLRSRQGRSGFNKNVRYSLEEDLTDWNTSKLIHATHTVFAEAPAHPLTRLLSGEWTLRQERETADWAESWLNATQTVTGLNRAQQNAVRQTFQHRLSLIEGPPGTGKTHLLGWILIALFLHAAETGERLFIVVSALTHHAINQVLEKVVKLVNQHRVQDFPAQCFKWGRWEGTESDDDSIATVKTLHNVEELLSHSHILLGATGFGMYQLLDGKNDYFPNIADWVVFDEASQMLIPQSLLSLLYGKGNFLFLGDVNQLPPIILSNNRSDRKLTTRKHLDQSENILYHSTSENQPDQTSRKKPIRKETTTNQTESMASCSILEQLLEHYPEQQTRLNITYRMNRTICEFPSKTWYQGELQPDKNNADAQLSLPGYQADNHPETDKAKACLPIETESKEEIGRNIFNPNQPVTLVLMDHQGSGQKCDEEAHLLAHLAEQLLIEYELKSEQIAIISPHRAQNNNIKKRLELFLTESEIEIPLIDTVERMQGAERDVILFGFTTSDPDQVESDFLNNPNRFNVVITRAKKKLIVVGSRRFFDNVAHQEEALVKNACFKEFYQFCEEQGSIFVFPS